MTRSARYLMFALGIVAALSAGLAGRAVAQVVPDAATPAKPETTQPPQIEEVKAAIELFKQSKFDECLASLEKAVQKHPELPPAQVIMFQLFAAANQPQAARLALEKAVLGSPDDPEAYAIFGSIGLQERRVTDAELAFLKARELIKSFQGNAKRKDLLEPQAISGLANVAEAREKWPQAQKLLEELLKVSPKNAMAMQRLGRALFQQQDAAGALTKLREAKAADKENTVLTPEAALARFYEQYGDHKNAVKWMTNALKASPDDLRTRLVAAQWALETDQIDEAKTQAERALAIDSRSLDAQILRGVVALFQKDFKEAEKWFQDAHLQSPSNFAASNNLALALCEQNDDAKSLRALEYANSNYQAYQKNADAASTLGWVLYKRGEKDRAELALRQALSATTSSADTVFYAAQLSFDRGRKYEAKVLLKAVLGSKRPFAMRKEATALFDKVKDEENPAKKETSSK